MDAIYWAGIDAGGVFCPDAGFGNDVGHKPPRPIQIQTMPAPGKIQAEWR
jgi:hypothetical protein